MTVGHGPVWEVFPQPMAESGQDLLGAPRPNQSYNALQSHGHLEPGGRPAGPASLRVRSAGPRARTGELAKPLDGWMASVGVAPGRDSLETVRDSGPV